jgi:xylan 1,4-beta-xylosidase
MRKFGAAVSILALGLAGNALRSQQSPAADLSATLNTGAAARPFPHFWEQMFGSGRAILSLREDYRRDLQTVRAITGLRYVRFHGIFDDETGVAQKDRRGNITYNFSYVDQIYDGLLENGARPFVELSFMPETLAASQTPHPFWYQPLPNPPVSYPQWGDLVSHFAAHLVERYGVDEVSQWYFEVWNEPNIDFWTGQPKQPAYFELYDAAATALKSVNPRLRVGGPSTAQAAWVDAMIAHASERRIPLDFVSTHVYANDLPLDVFGTAGPVDRFDMVARSVKKVYDQVKRSAQPELPIIWSEYNASYSNEAAVTDSAFMGPWLANNIRLCDGMQTMMSYWSFSDVFEEQGVVKTPFYGGFGLLAERGIPKPAFHAFELLARLGGQRLPADAPWLLATRRGDGALAIAAWNYAAPENAGHAVNARIVLRGPHGARARIQMVDAAQGSPLPAWEAMGRPASPTREQIRQLQAASQMPAALTSAIAGDVVEVRLAPHALALIEIME